MTDNTEVAPLHELPTEEAQETIHEPDLKNSFRDEADAAEMSMKSMETQFRPLEDRVLCKLEDVEEIKGGIIIPDAAQEARREAIVIQVGPGRTTDDGHVVPMKIVPGMRVMLAAYGGTNVKLQEAEYQLVFEREIMGVIVDVADEEEVANG